MIPDDAADAFWEWSIQTYADDDTREALLLLQNRYGYNVNVVLWCAWTARRGFELTDAQVDHIIKAVQPLYTYAVQPLRAVRWYMSTPKPGYAVGSIADLREQLLTVELEAERLVQHRLARDTATRAAPTDISPSGGKNLARQYFQIAGNYLEKPTLLADDLGPEAPAVLFERVLVHLGAETLT